MKIFIRLGHDSAFCPEKEAKFEKVSLNKPGAQKNPGLNLESLDELFFRARKPKLGIKKIKMRKINPKCKPGCVLTE